MQGWNQGKVRSYIRNKRKINNFAVSGKCEMDLNIYYDIFDRVYTNDMYICGDAKYCYEREYICDTNYTESCSQQTVVGFPPGA